MSATSDAAPDANVSGAVPRAPDARLTASGELDDAVEPGLDVADASAELDTPTEPDISSDPPAPDPACTSPDDQSAWQSLGPPSEVITDCMYGCMAVGLPCYQACYEELGLGPPCAACLTESTKCFIDFCMRDCLDRTGSKCRTCMETTCNPALSACTGLDHSKAGGNTPLDPAGEP